MLFCHSTSSGGGHDETSDSNFATDPKMFFESLEIVQWGTSETKSVVILKFITIIKSDISVENRKPA